MSGALYHDENDWGEPPGDRGASGVFAPVFSSLAVAVLLIAVKTSLATLKSPDGSSFPVHIEWTIARHAAEMTTCGPTVRSVVAVVCSRGVLRLDAQPHREADRDKHARTHARTHARPELAQWALCAGASSRATYKVQHSTCAQGVHRPLPASRTGGS